MEKIRIVYDHVGNTLDVWFTKPRKAICEEMGSGVILKKDKKGKVIGFEKLNFLPKKERAFPKKELPVEALVA